MGHVKMFNRGNWCRCTRRKVNLPLEKHQDNSKACLEWCSIHVCIKMCRISLNSKCSWIRFFFFVFKIHLFCKETQEFLHRKESIRNRSGHDIIFPKNDAVDQQKSLGRRARRRRSAAVFSVQIAVDCLRKQVTTRPTEDRSRDGQIKRSVSPHKSPCPNHYRSWRSYI